MIFLKFSPWQRCVLLSLCFFSMGAPREAVSHPLFSPLVMISAFSRALLAEHSPEYGFMAEKSKNRVVGSNNQENIVQYVKKGVFSDEKVGEASGAPQYYVSGKKITPSGNGASLLRTLAHAVGHRLSLGICDNGTVLGEPVAQEPSPKNHQKTLDAFVRGCHMHNSALVSSFIT